MSNYVSPNPKYIPQKDGSARCRDCGAEIMCIRQKRSVWDSPIPCTGSGEVRTVAVLYCPNCEKPPSSNGPPIVIR